MSEIPVCPYCGTRVDIGTELDYDKKVNLRCSNCSGLFEYLPGFGSFSLQDGARDDTQVARPMDERRWARQYADGFEDAVELEGSSSACGTACVCIFCLCFLSPTLMIVVYLIMTFLGIWF